MVGRGQGYRPYLGLDNEVEGKGRDRVGRDRLSAVLFSAMMAFNHHGFKMISALSGVFSVS